MQNAIAFGEKKQNKKRTSLYSGKKNQVRHCCIGLRHLRSTLSWPNSLNKRLDPAATPPLACEPCRTQLRPKPPPPPPSPPMPQPFSQSRNGCQHPSQVPEHSALLAVSRLSEALARQMCQAL